jgi:hypothetical protein
MGSGVRNWDDALASGGLTGNQRDELLQCSAALINRDAVYFGDML